MKRMKNQMTNNSVTPSPAIDCAVSQDLLPLFAEGLLSQQSEALVAGHLNSCPACRDALGKIKDGLALPTGESLPLQKLSKLLTRSRLRAALLAALLVAVLAVAAFSFASGQVYQPYHPGLVSFRMEASELVITINSQQIDGASISSLDNPDQPGALAYSLSLSRNRLALNQWLDSGKAGPWEADAGRLAVERDPHILRLDIPEGKTPSIYYELPGSPAQLIYGPGLSQDSGFMSLPRLALAYYLWLVLGFLALLLVLLLIFHKKPRARRRLFLALGLPLSYLLGHLLIMGFASATFSMLRDFGFILLTSLLLFLGWLAFWWGKQLG